MITLVIIPIIIGQIVLLPELLNYFYGDKWSPSVLPIQILSFYALFRSLGGLPTAILMAIGKHRIIPKLMAVYVGSTIVLLWPATIGAGIVGTSLTMSSVITIGAVIWLILTNKYLSISVKDFWHNISPHLIAAVIMGSFLWPTTQILRLSLVNITAITIVGGLIYLGGILLLTRGDIYREVKDIIQTVYHG
jgi:O-antigen/teichoic acid export membrane protein